VTPEEAKAEFEMIMQNGDRKKLDKFIKQSYEDADKAIAILDVLFPVATEEEREVGD